MAKVIVIPEGFIHSPLGNIPKDWRVLKIEDVVDVLDNLRKPLNSSERSDIKGDIPYYGANGVVDYVEGYLFDEDLILMAEDGGYFDEYQNRPISYKITGKSWVNNHAHVLRPKKNFDFDYILYCLQHKNILRFLNGGTRAKLNKSDLLSIPIQIANTFEQKKIAEILSTWDLAIEKTQKQIKEIKLRNKGLAQQLLTGKKRLKGFEGEWEYLRIVDVADQQTIYNKKNLEIEVLSCTKYDGLVRSLDYFGRQVFGDDLSKYKIVPKGSFAYATNHIEEGSIGYQNIMPSGLVSPMYTVFKTKSGINDNFFFRLLKTDWMIYAYQSNTIGSIDRRGGLRWNDFSAIHVNIPPIDEQDAITSVLEMADNELKLYEIKLATLKEQKKGLMQKLLTGQIRVKIN